MVSKESNKPMAQLTFVQGLGSDVELGFKPAKKNTKGRILTKMSA